MAPSHGHFNGIICVICDVPKSLKVFTWNGESDCQNFRQTAKWCLKIVQPKTNRFLATSIFVGFVFFQFPQVITGKAMDGREPRQATNRRKRIERRASGTPKTCVENGGSSSGVGLSQKTMERSTIFHMGKSTISTGPCSIAMFVYQRVKWGILWPSIGVTHLAVVIPYPSLCVLSKKLRQIKETQGYGDEVPQDPRVLGTDLGQVPEKWDEKN